MAKILNASDLRSHLGGLIERADYIQTNYKSRTTDEMVYRKTWKWAFKDQFMGAIFGEPSIRTRWSFTTAFERLGGKVVSSFGPGSTSSEKGESLYDMIMTASQMVEFLVIRQSEHLSTVDLSKVNCHIINAGDGNNEHPTQALLDAYTIWREFKRFEDLKILIIGDLRQSRAIHSLLRLLCNGNKFYLYDLRGCLDAGGWETPDSEMLEGINRKELLPEVDVVYLNRAQLERHKGEVNDFTFGLPEDLKYLSEKAIIMNPGPRREEMYRLVDEDPRCRYWQQVENGMYIRMALFHNILWNVIR